MTCTSLRSEYTALDNAFDIINTFLDYLFMMKFSTLKSKNKRLFSLNSPRERLLFDKSKVVDLLQMSRESRFHFPVFTKKCLK